MIFRTITITIALLLLITCNRDQQQTGICEVISIDPDNRQLISRSEMFSLNRIIQLEDNPQSVIGQTMWMDLLPGEDFILAVGEDIGLYDKTGIFLNNIGIRGRGPGEHTTGSKILPCNNGFRLLDNRRMKAMDYDIKGNFVGEYDVERTGQSFICWNDYNIVFNRIKREDYDKRLFLYDNKFNLLDSCFSMDEVYHYMRVIGGENFYIYNDSLRLFDIFDYNIYNVDILHDRLKTEPRYYIDFGKYEIPQSFYEQDFNDIREYRMAVDETNYAHNISGYFENDDNVIFSFNYKKSFYMAIYSKHTKKTIVIDEIYDDLIFDGLSFPAALGEFFSYSFFDNKVYFLMDAYKFLDNMNELKEKLSDKEWERYRINNPDIATLYNEVNEYDNPLIFVFDLKPVM